MLLCPLFGVSIIRGSTVVDGQLFLATQRNQVSVSSRHFWGGGDKLGVGNVKEGRHQPPDCVAK